MVRTVCSTCLMKTDMFSAPVTKECSHIEYGKQIAWGSVYGVSSAVIRVDRFRENDFMFSSS